MRLGYNNISTKFKCALHVGLSMFIYYYDHYLENLPLHMVLYECNASYLESSYSTYSS